MAALFRVFSRLLAWRDISHFHFANSKNPLKAFLFVTDITVMPVASRNFFPLCVAPRIAFPS